MVNKIKAQTSWFSLGFFFQCQVCSALDSVQGAFIIIERNERENLMRFSLPQIRRETLDASNTLLLPSAALQLCAESPGGGQVQEIPKSLTNL